MWTDQEKLPLPSGRLPLSSIGCSLEVAQYRSQKSQIRQHKKAERKDAYMTPLLIDNTPAFIIWIPFPEGVFEEVFRKIRLGQANFWL